MWIHVCVDIFHFGKTVFSKNTGLKAHIKHFLCYVIIAPSTSPPIATLHHIHKNFISASFSLNNNNNNDSCNDIMMQQHYTHAHITTCNPIIFEGW